MLPTVFGENLFDDFFADPFENGFDRSFYVGDVQPSEVKGKYESGVLTLTIPKKDQPQVAASNRIAIE